MGINFGLWAIAVIPAYFIVAQMGLSLPRVVFAETLVELLSSFSQASTRMGTPPLSKTESEETSRPPTLRRSRKSAGALKHEGLLTSSDSW